uniref:Uncharacterized protein n=1 Tax=Urocitellus parryii TaxID=9999 RepID=A0A8D2KL82_UROPR
MEAVPSSESPVATLSYHLCHLVPSILGETIPQHLGLLEADLGHWWASFSVRKFTLQFMVQVLKPPKHSEFSQAFRSMLTYNLAQEAPPGQDQKPGFEPQSIQTL